MADDAENQSSPSATAGVSVTTPAPAALPPSDLKTPNTQKFVATFVLISTMAILGLLCWHVVPPDNINAVMLVLGIIMGSYKDVMSYFFGSTDSSKSKDGTIAAMATAPPTTTIK